MRNYRWMAALALGAGLLSAQPAADPAARIRALNQQLTALGSQPRSVTVSRTDQLIRLRLAAFAELAATDPTGAMELLLPEATLAPIRTIAPAIVAGLEAEGEWSGPVDVVAEDDFEHQTSTIHLSIQVGAERLQVYTTDPARLRTGDIIAAAGVRMGRMLLVRKISLTARAEAAASACSTTGTQHLAILMVNFASSTINTSALNSTTFGNIISGSAHNLNGYWNEASYGLTSAAGDVFGPFNLNANYDNTQYDQLQADTFAAAASTVNFPNYTHIVIVMPNGFPVGGGLGTIGCRSYTSPTTFTAGVIWVRADFMIPNDVGVCALAHESGHNMGLNHASTESYGSVPLGSMGTVPVHNEYGSYFSLMSMCFTYNVTTMLGHYDAQHKIALGWFVPSNYQTVTTGGNFVLAPMENNTTNLHAIRVQRGQNNFWLWLEYRQNLGYDSTFSAFDSQIYSGAMIHFEDPTNTTYLGYTRLLNFTAPAQTSFSFSEPALAVGSTWSDPYSLLTLKATSADSAGLHVTVQYDTPCATLTPPNRNYSSSSAVIGDSVTITAPGTCAWTASADETWITVTNGASGSGNGTVTYSLAANTAPSVRTGTITIQRQPFTITQASSNPQPTPVSVSPTGGSSLEGTSKTFTLTYSDAGGAANLAQASVLFNTSSSPIAACSITWIQSNGEIRLADDAADGNYSYWYAAQNGQISNSQCIVNFSNAVAISGNNLTLTLTIQFSAGFTGAKNIYMEAKDGLGADSGMVQLGSWTVTGPAPALSVVKSHSGNFGFGQLGAAYSVVVSNGAGAASTSGTVTVTETVPTGMTLVSMAGSGWTCPANGTKCTSSDVLAGGASYSTITVTVNVAADAQSPLTNQVTLSGGGMATAVQANDSTTIVALSPCDTNLDARTNVLDVQKVIGQALGTLSAVSDLNQDGRVSVADAQIVVRAVLSSACMP